MTSGRGQFSMEFSHYLPCPQSVADAVVEAEEEASQSQRLDVRITVLIKKPRLKHFHGAFLCAANQSLSLCSVRCFLWVTRHATSYC